VRGSRGISWSISAPKTLMHCLSDEEYLTKSLPSICVECCGTSLATYCSDIALFAMILLFLLSALRIKGDGEAVDGASELLAGSQQL
jgi:hypothetical protein